MSLYNKHASPFYKVFSGALFVLLFLYLLLRAYFVEPLHDEVATFYHYIESGVYWGDKMQVDANNHLLNSWLCRGIYRIFGEGFFMLRLPNVLAFILFYWGIVKLIKPLRSNFSRMMILLALTCIPFMLEYFAYARGYGLSLGFFVCSLVYLRKFTVLKKGKYVLLTYLFLALTVYSNLTFLVSSILAVLLIVLFQLIYRQKFSLTEQLLMLGSHAIFLVALMPAVSFAQRLREAGALYYGSLDGFWNVTGKTLSRYILFYEAYWLKWLFALAAAGCIIFLVSKWRSKGTVKFFREPETMFAWFLFGNCAAILFMAKVMHVNYPEDRVGMYLVVLFILLAGFILGRHKKGSQALVLLLFFPLVFIPKINLSTSVFSPDDRMSQEFFNAVVAKADRHTTISVDPLMRLTWSYMDRKQPYEHFVSDSRKFNRSADIVLTKTVFYSKQSFLSEYEVIAHDPQSTFIAYRKRIPFSKRTIYKTAFDIPHTTDEFINVDRFVVPDSLRNKKLEFSIRADVHAENKTREFNIMTFSTFDNKDQPVRYQYWNERWSQGLKKNYALNFNYAAGILGENEHEIRIYMWNLDRERVRLKNGIFEIIILE